MFKAVHSSFHSCSNVKLSPFCISGAQKPESYSRLSVSIDCFSRSSRVLEGRPGLRSLLICASSLSLRCRYLSRVRKRIKGQGEGIRTSVQDHESSQRQEDLQRLWQRPGRTLSFALRCIRIFATEKFTIAYYGVGWPSLLPPPVSPASPSFHLLFVIFEHLCYSRVGNLICFLSSLPPFSGL